MAHLEGQGIRINRHDLAKEPPTRALLESLIDEKHLEDFINTRSPAYKAMNLASRKLTKNEAIDLMMQEPNLIRRPLVLAGRKAVFGYKPDEYDALTR